MSKKIMALLSIVEQDKGAKLIKALQEQNIRTNFQTVGMGTAPTELMDLFGLGTHEKDVIFSLGAEGDVQELLANFGSIFTSHSKYGGLMIVLDIAAASRVLAEILNFNSGKTTEKRMEKMKNEHHNNLIFISVNEGFSEAVMHVARQAGATGGTVLKGRLADAEQFSDFVTTEVSGEREILCILAPVKGSKQIMEDVNKSFGIHSPANGILFAVPTEKAYKI